MLCGDSEISYILDSEPFETRDRARRSSRISIEGVSNLTTKDRNEERGVDSTSSAMLRRVTSAFTTHEGAPGAVPDAAVPKVLRALLERIDQGIYEPGEKINTVELARALNLSRAPVREAIHILAGQGMVSLSPDRGAVLTPYDPTRVLATLPVLDLLFGYTLEECARKVDEGQHAKLLRQHRRNITDIDITKVDFTFYLAIHNFHYDVDRIAGNVVIDELSSKLNLDLLARTFSEYVEVGKHVDVYIQTYKRLIDALLAGDGGSAKATFSFHMRWQGARFREALAEREQTSAARGRALRRRRK